MSWLHPGNVLKSILSVLIIDFNIFDGRQVTIYWRYTLCSQCTDSPIRRALLLYMLAWFPFLQTSQILAQYMQCIFTTVWKINLTAIIMGKIYWAISCTYTNTYVNFGAYRQNILVQNTTNITMTTDLTLYKYAHIKTGSLLWLLPMSRPNS